MSLAFIWFLKIDLLTLILFIRVIPGSVGGDPYRRTELWVYFRPNHDLAGAALGLQGERSGTLLWSCHQGCHLLRTKWWAFPGLCEVVPGSYQK